MSCLQMCKIFGLVNIDRCGANTAVIKHFSRPMFCLENSYSTLNTLAGIGLITHPTFFHHYYLPAPLTLMDV